MSSNFTTLEILSSNEFLNIPLQSKRYRKLTKTGDKEKGKDFKALFSNMGAESSASKKKQNDDKRPSRRPKKVWIQKFSTTDPEQWVEEFQCGVRFWVNKETGEVSDECPWKWCTPDCPHTCGCYGKWDENGSYIGSLHGALSSQFDSDSLSQSSIGDLSISNSTLSMYPPISPGDAFRTSTIEEESEDNLGGCGALVYDSAELNNLFAILDAQKSKMSLF